MKDPLHRTVSKHTHMYPHTHTSTDTHKHHNTFKLTHTHTHTHKRPTQVDTSPSFRAAAVNVKQQNLNMANENIGSCVIIYCTSY